MIRFPQTDIEFAMQAEIDTLRAEVERLNTIIANMQDKWHTETAALRAEVERLLPMADADAFTITTLRAENERLREMLSTAEFAIKFYQQERRAAIEGEAK